VPDHYYAIIVGGFGATTPARTGCVSAHPVDV